MRLPEFKTEHDRGTHLHLVVEPPFIAVYESESEFRSRDYGDSIDRLEILRLEDGEWRRVWLLELCQDERPEWEASNDAFLAHSRREWERISRNVAAAAMETIL